MYNSQYLINPINESHKNNNYNKFLENKEKTLLLRESYERFSLNVQSFLVSESINSILQKCLTEKTNSEKEYGKVLCEQYVNESNPFVLMNRFKRGSLLLREMYTIIKETYDDVMCKVDDKNDLTFVIRPSDKGNFYDKLSDLGTDAVTDKINDRSCKAAQEFIQNNINDKLDMEEIAAKTQEKIDGIKAKTEEKRKMIQTEYTNMAKYQINQITEKRTKNVYEQMVKSTANQIISNEEFSKKFVNESGKLDMDSIIEKVDVMYRFLETINTSKIEEVDTKYVNNLVNAK